MADDSAPATAAGPLTSASLIPAALRAHLPRLRIAGRLAPPAGPLGQNVSRQRGQGLEFSQYRAYERGDEPRQIDWKLYARSDRFFVREADSESGLTFWVVLDVSASMLQADVDTPAHSKHRAALALAAASLDVALRQGDRFGLALVGNGTTQWLPAARGARHRDRCLLALLRVKCGGEWPPLADLRSAWSHIDAAAVVLLIGDGFDPVHPAFALQLAGTRRDVRNLVITAVDERDFAMRGAFEFVDPETGARIASDAAKMRDGFRQRFAAARAMLARQLIAAGIQHVEYVLDAPLDQPLRAVLDARTR